jgi:hypothetical protein
MVYTDKFSLESQEAIEKQLRSCVPALIEGATEIVLGQTFSVWELTADVIQKTAQKREMPDVLAIANDTSRMHHQVIVTKSPVAYARSIDGKICQLFVSPVVKKIDQEFGWIGKNAEGERLVRLLLIPAYQIVAFWLIDEKAASSQVLVIEFPHTFTVFEKSKLYRSEEFFKILSSLKQIVGIRPKKV